MSILNYLRKKAGHKSSVSAKPEYEAEVRVYLTSKVIYKTVSRIRANSNKEALSKLEKALGQDLSYRVKIKKK